MFCPKCGKKVPEGSAFCPSCGAKLAVSTKADAGQETKEAPKAAAAPKADGAVKQDGEKTAGTAAGFAPGAKAGSTAKSLGAVAGASKKGSRNKIIAIAAAAVVVLVLAFGVIGPMLNPAPEGGTGDQYQSGVNAPDPDSDDSADEDSSRDPGGERYQQFTVSDLEIETDAADGPKVTCTITNNSEQIAQDVGISATGTYITTNNYGDEVENEDSLDLICTEAGSNTIPYLFPGENEIELIPSDLDNIVASYSNGYTGETQNYRLQDLTDVVVTVSGGRVLDPSQYAVLDEDEYTAELQMALDGNYPVLNLTLTNNTDYRWANATVYVVAIDANGQRAHYTSGDSNSAAFSVGPLGEQYFKVGETKEMQTGYSSDLNVDHFEISRVVVQKELVDTGSDSSSSSED